MSDNKCLLLEKLNNSVLVNHLLFAFLVGIEKECGHAMIDLINKL